MRNRRLLLIPTAAIACLALINSTAYTASNTMPDPADMRLDHRTVSVAGVGANLSSAHFTASGTWVGSIEFTAVGDVGGGSGHLAFADVSAAQNPCLAVAASQQTAITCPLPTIASWAQARNVVLTVHTCDLGTVTVSPVGLITALAGFLVSTTKAAGAGCAGGVLYVKVHLLRVLGAADYYLQLPATGDYRVLGSDGPQTFEFSGNPHPIYSGFPMDSQHRAQAAPSDLLSLQISGTTLFSALPPSSM